MTSHSSATSVQEDDEGHEMKVNRFLIMSRFGHVSKYAVEGMERAMKAARLEGVSTFGSESRGVELLFKAAARFGLVRNLHRSSKGPAFCVCMGLAEYRTIPQSYWTEIIPYCFDCWPDFWPRWQAFFQRHRVRLAFFSARQAAEHFQKVLPEMNAIWLPEATDPARYSPGKRLVERGIDVLELGRRNDHFHARILDRLRSEGYVHLYEVEKGKIIFPTNEGLLQGFGDTKISVCFPSSLTHPERSGSVETVTHRYFESIASKCIVLGSCPAELKDLFGYDPVVAVNAGSEGEQLNDILSNVEAYQDLVDKNYARLLEVGTWTARIRQMTEESDAALGVMA